MNSKTSKNVLIGCTGSVASIKVPLLSRELISRGFNVQVVTTQNACHFFKPDELHENVRLWTDKDEWQMWNGRGDPVIHIELRRWADVLVIAPLDANTLAKMSHGLCDNLLTCVVRAWDMKKPLLFAPAMNTYMWDHPLTAQHLKSLNDMGYKEIPCVEKLLVCGDSGKGAMAEVSTIVESVVASLDSS